MSTTPSPFCVCQRNFQRIAYEPSFVLYFFGVTIMSKVGFMILYTILRLVLITSHHPYHVPLLLIAIILHFFIKVQQYPLNEEVA